MSLWIEEPSNPEVVAARQEAIERVDRNADEDWKERAYATLIRVAKSKPIFTADDLWEAGLERPHTPSALGPVFLRAARKGVIEKTGRMVLTRDPVRHRDLVVWASRVVA